MHTLVFVVIPPGIEDIDDDVRRQMCLHEQNDEKPENGAL
jgi:hypothetical protein